MLARLLMGAAALSLGACSVTAARMAIPAHLSTASTFQIAGVDAGTRGTVWSGDDHGAYHRGAGDLSGFGFWRESGRVEFDLAAGVFDGLHAHCRFERQGVTAGGVDAELDGYGYRCDLAESGAPAGRLVVSRSLSGLGALTREARTGFVMLDGTRLEIRSEHAIAGSPFSSEAPMGYVFIRGGAILATLDLNASPAEVRHEPTLSRSERRAVGAAAAALALVWDPAD